MISQWHRLVESGNPYGLKDILADDVVFHSPVVHSPQRGKDITRLYLGAAFTGGVGTREAVLTGAADARAAADSAAEVA